MLFWYFWGYFLCNLTDVYLSLNGDIIPNDGYVVISDISYTDDTALLCFTNHPPPPGSHHSGGDWFASNGARVGSIGSTDVPGFWRNRGPRVVRLLKNTGTPPQGIYRCSIMHTDGNDRNVYVGLYNEGQGNFFSFISGLVIWMSHMLQDLS